MISSHGQDPNGKGPLDGLIKPGTRAMAIEVRAVDNLVLPGSSIDVIQTIPNDQKKAEEKIILENLKVLALDNKVVQPGAMIIATLEVTPKQAQTLAKDKNKGPLTLRLHPPEAAGKKGGEPAKQQDDEAQAGGKKKEAKLPCGKEPFTISVGPGQIQDGFVLCGIFVDISYQTDYDGKKVSRMVAENVMVRSTDGTFNLFGDGPPTPVTLMVSEEQARTIKLLKGGLFVLTVRRDNFNSKEEFIRLPP
jgi:Flp pilus assembly protein CpaB